MFAVPELNQASDIPCLTNNIPCEFYGFEEGAPFCDKTSEIVVWYEDFNEHWHVCVDHSKEYLSKPRLECE